MSERIRILIVDDHAAVAESLQALLSRQPDFELTDTASDGASALRIATHARPQVVLMDQRLGRESGVDVAASIIAAHPNTAIVMLSGDMSQDDLIAAVEVGVSGYLIKTINIAQVISAIRRAAAGEILLPQTELTALLRLRGERSRVQAERQRVNAELTPREREVLLRMAAAMDAQRIADEMGISINTVRGHIQSILEKLGAHSRLEAVVKAGDLGLLAT